MRCGTTFNFSSFLNKRSSYCFNYFFAVIVSFDLLQAAVGFQVRFKTQGKCHKLTRQDVDETVLLLVDWQVGTDETFRTRIGVQ